MRARYIHEVRAMTRMITTTEPVSSRPKKLMSGSEPPKNFEITINRNRLGMLSMASVKRIKTLSIHPP